MASLYTFPVFTAIAEPLINKKPIQRKDIWLSLLILLGIVIMVPEWNIQNTMMQGVLLGVSSSLIYIYRNIGIRKHLSHINSSQLVYGQVIVVSLCLLPILMQSTFTYEAFDIPLLLAIGIGVTAFSHSVFAQSIQVLSAKTASIIFSAQPLLATIIAFFVLNEVPTWQTVIGGMCILVAVYMEVVQIKA
jgi:drug/metabolite transporter (DMT)-like permease